MTTIAKWNTTTRFSISFTTVAFVITLLTFRTGSLFAFYSIHGMCGLSSLVALYSIIKNLNRKLNIGILFLNLLIVVGPWIIFALVWKHAGVP